MEGEIRNIAPRPADVMALVAEAAPTSQASGLRRQICAHLSQRRNELLEAPMLSPLGLIAQVSLSPCCDPSVDFCQKLLVKFKRE